MTEITHCLLTGIPLIEKIEFAYRDNSETYWYAFEASNVRIHVSICRSLYEELMWSESEVSKVIKENKTLLIGEFAKDDFKLMRGKVFHWACDVKEKKNHIRLKEFIEEITASGNYPKNRKEKYDNLLRFLHQTQGFDGGEVAIRKTVDFYGKLFFQSFEELQFFLREMQRKELIEYNEEQNKIQFTFFGLEQYDTLIKSEQLSIGAFAKPSYDIGLSFAGEDREYVEKVADKLRQLNISVFYDNYEQVNLWGKDLYQHLNDVYKNKCQYCIVFISENYSRKLWTQHELKSAQTRAFNENKEYILPARFDNTEVPGLNSTVGYLDCLKVSPEEIALLAAEKLKQE